MKKSLQTKLLTLFLLSIFVAIFSSLTIHFLFFRDYYLNHTEKRLLSVYEEVKSHLSEPNFEEIVADVDFRHQVGIIIANEEFTEPFFSHILTEDTNLKLSNELQSLIKNQWDLLETSHICVELRSEGLDGEGKLERIVFIKKLDEDTYCILSHPLESLESSMEAMNSFHLVAGIIACLFGGASTHFLAKGFTKPILEINKATEKMSQLDFQQKITHNSQDELGQLAGNINMLSHTLEEYQHALKKEIDFQKILSQNMSHELKTPIAVMKGYLEAISYGVAAKKGSEEEYVRVVLLECDRMAELVNQMLELSRLTTALEHTLEKTWFTSTDFVEKLRNQQGALLEQKGLSWKTSVDSVEILGNQELLLQGVGNFVTNAVKYGDGVEINLTVLEKNDCISFAVFNTGVPIQEEELEKVFDVFYMVDKARSRAENSHGLGLSVSKSVAELHDGYVYCENTLQGVTFYLEIPKFEKV